MKPTFLKYRLILLPAFLIISVFLTSVHAKEKIAGLDGYYKTMSFEVWAKNKKLAKKIAGSAEAFYKGLLKDLKYGGMLKKRCKIYIFGNRQAFLEHLGGKAIDATYAGAMAIPRRPQQNPEVYGYECEGLLEYILPHELTHHIYREYTVGIDIRTPIPLWINEGMACYEEHNPRYVKTAKAAVRENSFIGLRELFSIERYPDDPGQRSLFYAESTSVVEFLISTYGGRKFLNFSRKLIKDKRAVDAALKAVYYPHIKNTEDLEMAWLTFLKTYSAGKQ